MKKINLLSIILMLCATTLLAAGGKNDNTLSKNDTNSYQEFYGKIIDVNSNESVIFATVSITGTNMATVSNSDGEYAIKIPKSLDSGTLSFSHLGYKNKSINISELKNGLNIVALTPVSLTLDEVIVKNQDPVRLIKLALDKVKDNYSNQPEMQTSFYREAIKQNRNYVSVSEAVVDIYKAPYTSGFDGDRMKIYKGRSSKDVKKMDTLLVKLQGGPNTTLLLDVVKNPGDILDPEMLQYYDFKLLGKTTIDGKDVYIINFDQVSGLKVPLYAGHIYIDVETNAFVRLDFGLSEKGLPYAADFLVAKKPANLKIEVESANYLIKYTNDDNEYHLSYVRSELAMNSKWKKKLFKTDINVMIELAITDRSKENIQKFTGKESAKKRDIFADQVSSFEDNNFWGDYNTIKPNESIEEAIKKLNKKLMRRQ